MYNVNVFTWLVVHLYQKCENIFIIFHIEFNNNDILYDNSLFYGKLKFFFYECNIE